MLQESVLGERLQSCPSQVKSRAGEKKRCAHLDRSIFTAKIFHNEGDTLTSLDPNRRNVTFFFFILQKW